MQQSTRTRVAIIFGGVSSEHDVSCLTAGGVVRAIDPQRFEVIGIGITPSGRWVQVDTADLLALNVSEDGLPRLDESRPEAVLIRRDGGGRIATVQGDRVRAAIAAIDSPLVAGTRGQGLLIGVALHEPVAGAVVAAAQQYGLIVNAANDRTIRLAPPLVIGDVEVDEFAGLFSRALGAVHDALLPDDTRFTTEIPDSVVTPVFTPPLKVSLVLVSPTVFATVNVEPLLFRLRASV